MLKISLIRQLPLHPRSWLSPGIFYIISTSISALSDDSKETPDLAETPTEVERLSWCTSNSTHCFLRPPPSLLTQCMQHAYFSYICPSCAALYAPRVSQIGPLILLFRPFASERAIACGFAVCLTLDLFKRALHSLDASSAPVIRISPLLWP